MRQLSIGDLMAMTAACLAAVSGISGLFQLMSFSPNFPGWSHLPTEYWTALIGSWTTLLVMIVILGLIKASEK